MASGPHALIIEDDALSALEVKRCLKTLGFESFAFAAAQAQALEQARLRRPDLVTVDIALLDGDGEAAAQALAAEFGSLKMIFITGSAEAGAAAVGAHVQKPFSERDLLRAWRLLENGDPGV